MITLTPYLLAFLPAALLTVVVWAVSAARRDASLVDRIWGVFFALILAAYLFQLEALSHRAWLIATLVLLWSARLSIYITWRNWGHGEDRRYQKIRERNQPNFALKSLLIVFGFQALLAWIIAAPLVATAGAATPLNWIDYAGVTLWIIGMLFEGVGDWQLSRFLANPDNRGKVLDQGLWRYTRHPNYFGECALWWGYYLLALAAGAWWTIYAPLIMTLFLLKVSGVSLLEEDIGERRPKYRDYVRRTSAFFPRPPSKNSDHGSQETQS